MNIGENSTNVKQKLGKKIIYFFYFLYIVRDEKKLLYPDAATVHSSLIIAFIPEFTKRDEKAGKKGKKRGRSYFSQKKGTGYFFF